jgi:hypothetical protein
MKVIMLFLHPWSLKFLRAWFVFHENNIITTNTGKTYYKAKGNVSASTSVLFSNFIKSSGLTRWLKNVSLSLLI